jgi:hypothetical protein
VNGTGISWFNLADHMKFQDPNRTGQVYPVRLEATYLVTPEQMASSEFYQRVRRAAFFDLGYSMGGGLAIPNRPNRLSGSEHCLTFAYGSSIERDIQEMTGLIGGLPTGNGITTFINEAKRFILSWSQPEQFEPNQLSQMRIGELSGLDYLRRQLGTPKSEAELATLARWIVVRAASLEYQRVLTALGMNDALAITTQIPARASAILIYDPAATAFTHFSDGSYTASGRHGTWSPANQTPVRYSAIQQ